MTKSVPESNLSDPAQALRLVRDDLGDCTRCPLHNQGRKQIVFGAGNPRAELVFVGEGPGADEDEQGEPFVGRAGQLLNNMIKAMGITREQVYIANVVKCRPPGNRTPEAEECATCFPFLMRQIAVVKPKVIVALGAVAANTLLAINASVAELRGRWYEFRPGVRSNDPSWGGAKLAVTFHPAFLLRDPRQKKEAWKDLQMVMKELGLGAQSSQSIGNMAPAELHVGHILSNKRRVRKEPISDERRARRERIRNAFSKALDLETGPFNLKGRGHEPRTTLQSSIARILNGLELPYVSVSRGYSLANYYPLRLVNRAAQLLDTEASQFTSTISLASDGPRPRPTTWTSADGTIHRRISRRQLAQLLRPGTKLTWINSSLGPCSIPYAVISADSKGLVFDNRPRTAYANHGFMRFDEIFFDLKRNIITIKNRGKIREQYRIETVSEVGTQ